ncbi:MAG: sulfatase [Candidatus Hydrogenedentes bacterium]|nr:sulfatase [Candidatus Hydrogenedentota bacterium]
MRTFSVSSLLLLLVCTAMLTACRPAEEKEAAAPGAGYNVAVILVDTLRPDHLGCFGHDKPTSPFIDGLAKEGVLFEEARSASTFTGEAVAALLTGRPPAMSESGLGWTARPAPMEENLPGLFQRAGYRTGIFSTSFVMRFKGFYDSFQESELFPSVPNTSALDDKLTDAALAFAERHRDVPTFQYLHYYAPHAPYNPPEAFLRPFDIDRELMDPASEVHPAALVARGMKADDPRLAELRKHYDAEIAFIDGSIRRYVEGLEKLGTLSRTVIVLVSDHGEEFMEHGFADHAWNLHEETLRIPMILWAPSLFAPRRVRDPVSIVDIMPTLLRCLHVPHEAYGAPEAGQYLFQARDEAWGYVPRRGPIYASLFPESRAQLHSVVFEQYKYIAGPRWLEGQEYAQFWMLQNVMAAEARTADFLPMNPWAPPEREALYDLKADPDEKHDVAREMPEVLERGRALMKAYQRASVPFRSALPAGVDSDPFGPEYVTKGLKTLAEGASEGAEPTEGIERIDPEVIEGLETMGYL